MLRERVTVQVQKHVGCDGKSHVNVFVGRRALNFHETGFRHVQPQFPKTRAVSTGRCNTGLEFTGRSFKAQGFSRALI
jgi:hypothetical protein